MSLYHTHRPELFDDVIGNEDIIKTLQAMLNKKEKPHAFLLHGPTGCGKTTLGRIIATALGCVGNDFREVDSADFRGIDTIREMRRAASYKALEGTTRVWLLDECHKLSNDAQNALLKALEDTPQHVYYILATTDPQKLLSTIRGRCSQFQVSLLKDKEMFFLLRKVVKLEKESLQKLVYEQIIQDSQGHPRNALQILEQVLSVPVERRLSVAQKSAETQSKTIELCRALLGNLGWKAIALILRGLKDEDPESIRRAVLGYCNSVLLSGENERAGKLMEMMMEPTYNTGWPGITFACYAVVCGE